MKLSRISQIFDYRVNGNQLVITKCQFKESGELTLKKSANTGTPVAYKMAGQQTLMAGGMISPIPTQSKLMWKLRVL